MKYPLGSKVRFWCDVYSTSFPNTHKPFWSYGTILMYHDSDERFPYFIKWMENDSSYNGMGTQAWWPKDSPYKLQLVKEPNEVLKEIL